MRDAGPAAVHDLQPGTGSPGGQRGRMPGVSSASGRVRRAAVLSGSGSPAAGGHAVRFREDRPADLIRARDAVAAWREQHPQGTAGQLVGDLGGGFHKDYGVVLRAVLFAVDSHGAKITAGVSIVEADR